MSNQIFRDYFGIVNVKDYGAVGDGVTDDTTSIQNAINAAAALGIAGGTVTKGAEVWIPPGEYKITSALKNNVGGWIGIRGAGKHNTALVASGTPGYVIDQVQTNSGAIEYIGHMTVGNGQSNGGSLNKNVGAIRMNGAQNAIIEHCLISADSIGIACYFDPFNMRISNCDLSGDGSTGSVGILCAQVGIYQTSCLGFDVGIQAFNGGVVLSGTRTETCQVGVVLGRDENGSTSTLSGCTINAHTTERCNGGIFFESVADFVLSGVTTTGTVDVAGTGTPTYGYRIKDASQGVFIGCVNSAYASYAGFDLNNASAHITGNRVIFIGCGSGVGTGGGATWILPGANTPTFYRSSYTYINCDNPTAAFPFADLPASPVEGQLFAVTDCNSVVWGATAAAATASAGFHALVRYNGSNWSVVGK